MVSGLGSWLHVCTTPCGAHGADVTFLTLPLALILASPASAPTGSVHHPHAPLNSFVLMPVLDLFILMTPSVCFWWGPAVSLRVSSRVCRGTGRRWCRSWCGCSASSWRPTRPGWTRVVHAGHGVVARVVHNIAKACSSSLASQVLLPLLLLKC